MVGGDLHRPADGASAKDAVVRAHTLSECQSRSTDGTAIFKGSFAFIAAQTTMSSVTGVKPDLLQC